MEGIGSWTARRAERSPGRIALVHEEREWSYARLHERVTRLAGALRELGVSHGDRVAYLGKNHPCFLETLFAAGTLGAIFVPLNFRLAAPELAFVLNDCEARVLIHAPDQHGKVSGIRDEIAVQHHVALAGSDAYFPAHGFDDLMAQARTGEIDESVDLDEVAIIMYTSGTTGRPKGAMLSHANILWNCLNMLTDVDVRANEVSLVVAPMFHTAGLNMATLPTLLKGGKVLLESSFDPQRALELIEARGVTSMFGVPAMFNAIAASPRWEETDLSSIRTLQCGGAPLPLSCIRSFGQRGLGILQGYGSTETAPGALLLRAHDALRKVGSAGTAHFFTDVRVVRPDLTDVSPGEPGEVIVRGPNVMKGYWRRRDETAAVFTGDWFHSGDIATIDDEGYVFITDRMKDMIISGGENIYPAEVENALHEHPGVAECAVIGMADERWSEVGKAIVVLHPGAEAGEEELLGFLEGVIARYKIPASVVFVDALPRNAAGKILKTELRRTHVVAPARGSAP